MTKKKYVGRPSVAQLEAEIKRVRYRSQYASVLKSTVYALVIVAAFAILVATLWLPVLQIYGSSMNPTLHDGDILVSVKGSDFKHGDVVAFYYNNKILVKRVIAVQGEWVDIDEDGNVYVNEEKIDEPYVSEHAKGECNIELPYQVPDSRLFVMGDHRSVSIDSRSTSIGCVSDEQIVGKLVYQIWPLTKLGSV